MLSSKNKPNNIIKYTYLSHDNNSNIIHIGYGIDNNYARCCATSIASFCINNPNQNFTFHIITNNLSLSSKEKYNLLAKDYLIDIYIYEIDPKELSNLPTQTHLPIATYFRFLLPLIIKDIDILYYIDADILCLQNTSELFNTPLNNYIIGAVSDIPKMNKKRNKALNLQDHIYFNAGMLAINIKKWIEFDTFNKVLNVIHKNPKRFSYLDQDALNLVLHNHIKYFNSKFNCLDISKINTNDIVLLHLAAHPKPWNIAFSISNVCNDFNKNLYKSYEDKTPWKDTPLEQPRNYKELKVYSKALRYNKKYIKGFYYYIKYLINKINKKFFIKF